MVRMKVVDANGESSMDEDQWEAASMCDFASITQENADVRVQISILLSLLRSDSYVVYPSHLYTLSVRILVIDISEKNIIFDHDESNRTG